MNIFNLVRRKIELLCNYFYQFDSHMDEIKLNQGLILLELMKKSNSRFINDYEFKIFSQFGEDGIIQ